MKLNKNKILAAAAVASAFFTSSAGAGPLAIYNGPAIDKSSIACGSFGDAVSCALPWLNVLAGLAETTKTSDNPAGYVQASSQGLLKDSIVVQAGGAAALGNGDTNPAPASVENGFQANTSGDNYLATGKSDGTTMSAGNMTDPTNNNLTAAQDNIGTWDVSTTWLKDALTTSDGKRHELMVMFDYNQPQSSTTSMNIWGLVTVRDSTGNLADINYEFNNDHSGPTSFTSSKNFLSQPAASDFETVSGTICIYQNVTFPNAGGTCPAATVATGPLLQTIDNAQGTEATEFAAFFPELNANLENYIAQGYDTISVRLLMGCFGGTSSQNGQGYLSSGETTNCDSGGFGDVYIMGGAAMPTVIPEPSTLALAALGLLGGGLYRRQRKS